MTQQQLKLARLVLGQCSKEELAELTGRALPPSPTPQSVDEAEELGRELQQLSSNALRYLTEQGSTLPSEKEALDLLFDQYSAQIAGSASDAGALDQLHALWDFCIRQQDCIPEETREALREEINELYLDVHAAELSHDAGSAELSALQAGFAQRLRDFLDKHRNE